MKESILYELYNTMVEEKREVLIQKPYYQTAMRDWEAKRTGSEIDQEDGAWTREDAWGEIAFSIGVDLGIRLARELEAFGADAKP
ncbi:MAG: hypothetical protein HFF18_04760 [Oscillospiraceae bacterium]|nr:hypothetical protein [Oscillospiraceae bacterium]